MSAALHPGAIVDVDALGMAVSTVQVVLVPIVAGLFLNKTVPKVGRGGTGGVIHTVQAELV